MHLVVQGHTLPGLRCGAYDGVHVALQVGREPQGLVPGDAPSATWTTEVRALDVDGGTDLRGPAVHGRRGDRFLYLTWGEVSSDGFAMFRRAKLMLGELGGLVVAQTVVGRLALTDGCGLPICAQVRPPAITWTAQD
ncbi:MAG: hypothetical protein AVDCRST_MAG07-1143 [uncultured Frankineae bacterium]|uniref:Monooxygenase n=1 Tax=uncultured Frankineae bacterium TaxID=437475 RepID=A0A6J4L0S7_9ACTN|nr:MAG: hypothetical protein AVDCRST_MAG07-1143 [uncultured Frankineae bacterium]